MTNLSAKIISLCLCLTGGMLEAADFFSCDFTEMTAGNGQNMISPIAKKGEYRTITGFGNSGRGAVFAMENLQDFKGYAKMDPLDARPAVLYTGLQNFPAEEGYCELWAAPFFNQQHAYRHSQNQKLRLYYIFSLFCHAPGTAPVARSGKSMIDVYIHEHRLNVRFSFTDGTSVVLGTSVKHWNRKQFHKITVIWGKEKQQLCVDRKIAAENRKSGTLGNFNSLELGGRDVSLSFQGIIDDVKISSGRPLDIVPPNFEGDPKKFKSVPVPRAMLKKWENEPKNAEITVTEIGDAVCFAYAGKKQYLQMSRMTEAVPVRAGSVLRTDLVFKKKKMAIRQPGKFSA